MKQYGALTDFKCPILFSSEFSILPKKIREYLRADSPWNANTWIMKILALVNYTVANLTL